MREEQLVCSRIDRFLFFEGWGEMFQLTRQEALVRATLDHCPILLDTNNFKWGPTPFRFENMWLRNKDFKSKFKQWWDNSVQQGWEGFKFMRKLESVKNEVKKWSREVFGDVQMENNALLSRIGELDKIKFRGELDKNKRVEQRELEDTILREEISWNQKVRIKGVTEWDSNY